MSATTAPTVALNVTESAATEIREGGDRGVPVVVSSPDQPAGQAFIRIAQALRQPGAPA